MSTQVLYHAFGVADYHHKRFENDGGTLIFELERPRRKRRCAACGSARVHGAGCPPPKAVKTLPVGRKPVVLLVPRQRFYCLDCGCTRQDRSGLVEGKRRYTKQLERFVVDLCRVMTISDVAALVGLGWDTVKEIEKRYLARRFDPPRLRHVRRIAIDEIAVRKGHDYKTIVLDLDSGRIVFVGDGKGADALAGFFRRLRSAGGRLEAVAMDMAGGYLAALRRYMPDVPVVFDRFHVIKLVNEKIDELRRRHMRDCTKAQRSFLKGSRYLLLMSAERLDKREAKKPGGRKRLERALALNEPLNKAYYLKEKLRAVWDQPTLASGRSLLYQCVSEAIDSGVPLLQSLAKTLVRHAEGILGYFRHRITSGPLEGVNNKIKVLKRKAYGYRDDEFFRLKLLGLHETRYAFVG